MKSKQYPYEVYVPQKEQSTLPVKNDTATPLHRYIWKMIV